jgi:hypothetical protein
VQTDSGVQWCYRRCVFLDLRLPARAHPPLPVSHSWLFEEWTLCTVGGGKELYLLNVSDCWFGSVGGVFVALLVVFVCFFVVSCVGCICSCVCMWCARVCLFVPQVTWRQQKKSTAMQRLATTRTLTLSLSHLFSHTLFPFLPISSHYSLTQIRAYTPSLSLELSLLSSLPHTHTHTHTHLSL